jgi:hypothetical protein
MQATRFEAARVGNPTARTTIATVEYFLLPVWANITSNSCPDLNIEKI